MIPTTSMTPTHMPALKMSPISSQLLKLSNTAIASNTGKNEYCLISFLFTCYLM